MELVNHLILNNYINTELINIDKAYVFSNEDLFKLLIEFNNLDDNNKLRILNKIL